ncbi:O-acetyl-ADP-ribose deacetylase MACROD2 [Liparis tanakae]|uniref:O-acetyl-ADP-ribose deacetylase MACROD2 n=1 Tax=Liparis tanakae TaxID=230148 RepID=A0A4Z2I8P1_9TELE|nr:O-acetyl-ADP-ribose deacetylase MACROD2 [Liparis tanakae]
MPRESKQSFAESFNACGNGALRGRGRGVSYNGGSQVDGCIHKAAGSCLYDECRSLNCCETGKAKITCGYDLPAKYVASVVVKDSLIQYVWTHVFNVYFSVVKFWLSSHIWLFRLVSSHWQPQRASFSRGISIERGFGRLMNTESLENGKQFSLAAASRRDLAKDVIHYVGSKQANTSEKGQEKSRVDRIDGTGSEQVDQARDKDNKLYSREDHISRHCGGFQRATISFTPLSPIWP